MIKRILLVLFIAIVLALVALWFISGGVGRVVERAKSIGGISLGNPISFLTSTSSIFSLPGQPSLPRGIDISPLVGEGATPSTYSTGGGSQSSATQTWDFGNPSPYRGAATLGTGGISQSDPQLEYLTIATPYSGQAVDITGWSLQSVLSGVRAYIPRGAPFFTQGTVNNQTDIVLEPGSTAIVSSGHSPVGTSFRVNACSGYLGQMQRFSPALSGNCPAPSDEYLTARSYGDSCASYVSSLPSCTLPLTTPTNLPVACRMFVQDMFSYSGCMRAHQGDTGFARREWHIYLGASGDLWGNGRDSIRLLDAQGRTVDLISY